jgi:chromosomal replication initiator protein
MKIDSALIVKEVSDYYNQTIDELKSSYKDRHAELVKTRQITMYFLKEFTNTSLSGIGKVYLKDHATVINSCRHVRDLCDTDKNYNREVSEIRRRILKYISNEEGISIQYYLMGIYGKQIAAQNIIE